MKNTKEFIFIIYVVPEQDKTGQQNLSILFTSSLSGVLQLALMRQKKALARF